MSVAETISHYTIVRKLGAGGMGEVYLAEDTKLRRPAALKVLPPGIAGDANRRRRFLQEAHAASLLNHPNIGVIYEVGEASDGTPFIAMEYIDGITLDSRIAGKPLPLSDILDLGIEVADAMDEAHSKGVLHRDIKPSNIMLTARGHAKVLDFGLAKLLDDATGSDADSSTRLKTDAGLVMGTVSYMSPEQALGQPVDPRSDLFSLGALFYEMATGRLPFAGKTTTETIEMIRHAQPDAIARYNYAVPAELERIVRKLLEKEPDNRYQSARDLVVDLKTLRRDSTSGERTAVAVAPPKKSLALPMAIGVAALVLAALTIIAVKKHSPVARAELKLKQVTYEPGLESEPSLSKDGKLLAYTTDDPGNLDIRVLPTDGGQAIRVAESDADEAQPSWSPDGSKIAFVSARDHNGRLFVPLGVGPLQPYVLGRGGDIFITAALGGSAAKLVSDAYYPAWSPDGKEIVFQSALDRDLWVIAAGGGEPRRLTEDGSFDYHPEWSPDGKWIVYAARLTSGQFEIRVVGAAGGQPRRITAHTAPLVSPIWSADGQTILFSMNSSGRMNVWKTGFDPDDSEPRPVERVTVGEGNDVFLSGPDAKGRLAFATVKQRSDIHELTVEGGALRQVTSETVIEDYAELSKDGKTLALMSDRDGAAAIWTADLQGRLLARIGPGIQTRWSPDGREIAYASGAPLGIIVQRLGDLSSKTVVPNATFPEWSSDGSHLIFERATENKRMVFLKNLSDGTERQLTPPLPTSAAATAISPDGRYIAYQADEAGVRQLWLMPMAGGEPKRLTSGASESSHPRFRPGAPDWIVYLEDHRNIILRSLTTGETRRLTNFTYANHVVDYPSWSPDGTKIYFTIIRSVGDVFLLENY